MGCYDSCGWVLKHGAGPLHDKIRVHVPDKPCAHDVQVSKAQALYVSLQLLGVGVKGLKDNFYPDGVAFTRLAAPRRRT
jgi:hypothetical protein